MPERQIKTLILEDDRDDLLLLEKFISKLKRRELKYSAAMKLSGASELLKHEDFDLIISDLTVPDCRGLETFRSLRAAAPHTPIILLTGVDDEDLAKQAIQEGAQDYLVKGEITPGLLLRAAVYAIERNRLIQERLRLISELTDAISKVKTLSGLLPICAGCKKIRNDKGYWEQVELFLKEHSEVEFTHGFCPDCMERLYPEFVKNKKNV